MNTTPKLRLIKDPGEIALETTSRFAYCPSFQITLASIWELVAAADPVAAKHLNVTRGAVVRFDDKDDQPRLEEVALDAVLSMDSDPFTVVLIREDDIAGNIIVAVPVALSQADAGELGMAALQKEIGTVFWVAQVKETTVPTVELFFHAHDGLVPTPRQLSTPSVITVDAIKQCYRKTLELECAVGAEVNTNFHIDRWALLSYEGRAVTPRELVLDEYVILHADPFTVMICHGENDEGVFTIYVFLVDEMMELADASGMCHAVMAAKPLNNQKIFAGWLSPRKMH